MKRQVATAADDLLFRQPTERCDDPNPETECVACGAGQVAKEVRRRVGEWIVAE